VLSDLIESYNNKSVLVTGHTGFKGSWLAIWLRELGADVIGYSLEPPSEPSNFRATRLEEKITHVTGDIRDLERLIATIERYRPEFVFHLAAQPIVRFSYNEPKLTFDTNVGGTVNVLEACRQVSCVRVLVNVTSDKCYENRECVRGYRECDPLGGYDPYSASKACAELVFSAYLRSFFSQEAKQTRAFGAASARAGNVIGGGDWGADRLVPDCVRALSRHQAINIRCPRSIRPWQHVLEPLRGYLQLGALLSQDPDKYSGAWNFGPTEGSYMRVSEIADKLIGYWGGGSWNDCSGSQVLHEANLLVLNCDKARAELQWRNSLTINECLQLTVDWYKRFYISGLKTDMYPLCVEQLRHYEQKTREIRQVTHD